MKTKTDDYLEEILERFDEKLGQVLAPYMYSQIKTFISKEFREYAKNLNEDKNNRFFF